MAAHDSKIERLPARGDRFATTHWSVVVSAGGPRSSEASLALATLSHGLGAVTAQEIYMGSNGYSLRLAGLEPGFNDRARERAIVIHGAPYVNPATAQLQGRLGRSLGCPAVRLSALMNLQSLYIFTHDSFFVGEDGPTHQPIEHVASLRLIPGLQVLRPADGVETAMAWVAALKYSGPTALILTRQKLPVIDRPAEFVAEDALKGGYLVSTSAGTPDVVVMASGSEVHVAVEAAAMLADRGIKAMIVSVPCLESFVAQPAEYRNQLLPAGVPRVAFEAGRGESWGRLIGCDGLFIGIEHFGASAPDKVLAEQFGFTAPQVAEKIMGFLNKN